ncbi:MAG: hypothetical protein DRO16_03825, partial [Thermoprotei archaeon]
KKEHLTDQEKAEIERRIEWNNLIDRFVSELKKIGYRINWSVFLIPEENYEAAKNLVNEYMRKFEEKNVAADIYILRYHPESNATLITKLKLHMKMKIDKLIEKIKNAEDVKEIRQYNSQLNDIFDIARAFEVEDEIYKYYKEKAEKEEIPKTFIIRLSKPVTLFNLG